jgi:hypothetical protein
LIYTFVEVNLSLSLSLCWLSFVQVMDGGVCRGFLFDWCGLARRGVESRRSGARSSPWVQQQKQRERSGADVDCKDPAGRFWPSFASILELMLFGAVASYVVSLNVHIVVMFAFCVGSC